MSGSDFFAFFGLGGNPSASHGGRVNAQLKDHISAARVIDIVPSEASVQVTLQSSADRQRPAGRDADRGACSAAFRRASDLTSYRELLRHRRRVGVEVPVLVRVRVLGNPLGEQPHVFRLFGSELRGEIANTVKL